MSITFIIFLVLVLIILWFILGYNSFIRLINRAKEPWADIDVQLKRRYDLIPNIVSTVKGYAEHESSAFENVTKARASAMSANNIEEKGRAENVLSGALKSIFALSEAYPDLKANQSFLELQKELSDTENKIQAARRFYNTNVRDLNTKIESFPSNIIASIFHFAPMEFFQLEATSDAKETVKVSF